MALKISSNLYSNHIDKPIENVPKTGDKNVILNSTLTFGKEEKKQYSNNDNINNDNRLYIFPIDNHLLDPKISILIKVKCIPLILSMQKVLETTRIIIQDY